MALGMGVERLFHVGERWKLHRRQRDRTKQQDGVDGVRPLQGEPQRENCTGAMPDDIAMLDPETLERRTERGDERCRLEAPRRLIRKADDDDAPPRGQPRVQRRRTQAKDAVEADDGLARTGFRTAKGEAIHLQIPTREY